MYILNIFLFELYNMKKIYFFIIMLYMENGKVVLVEFYEFKIVLDFFLYKIILNVYFD